MEEVLFDDRKDAGARLFAALPKFDTEVVVVGLARGGVPVAAEVARLMHAPLDVLVVKKVGHPAQPEYALGAVSEDGVVMPGDLDPDLVAPKLEEARAKGATLRSRHTPPDVGSKTVVVVDDGLATGRSMAVALETMGQRGAERVVMAVPVAAATGYRALCHDYECYCPHLIDSYDFLAVGQFYEDFTQVSDAEVAEILSSAET